MLSASQCKLKGMHAWFLKVETGMDSKIDRSYRLLRLNWVMHGIQVPAKSFLNVESILLLCLGQKGAHDLTSSAVKRTYQTA